MLGGRGRLETDTKALASPVRVAWRVVRYALAVGLLVLVAVLMVAALTMAWFLPVFLVEVAVGLPVVGPVESVAVRNVPSTVAGVPTLYPLVMGILTALVLGWPDADRDAEIDAGIFRDW